MTSNEQKTPGKRKRTVLTLSQKVELCRRYNAGVDKQILMDEYNIGSSTVYDIKSREDEWLSVLNESAQLGRGENMTNRYKVRRTKMDELENILFEWFQLKREDGERVTGPMLIEKAKDLSEQLDLKESESCSFSWGWLTRFKGRYNIDKTDFGYVSRSADKISNKSSLDSSDDDDMSSKKLTCFEKCELKVEVKEEKKIFGMIGWGEAASAFSNLISFAKMKDCFSLGEMEQLERLQKVFLEKMDRCETQS